MTGRRFFVTLALALACGCGPMRDTSGGDPSGPSETGVATALTSSPTSTSTSDTATDTTSLGVDSTTTTTAEPTTTDMAREPNDCHIIWGTTCDPWKQDCPEGQKCNWYGTDGGSTWHDSKCFPILDDPATLGEPCFVVDGPTSGVDNCERGTMCWNDDAKGMHCVALCGGCPETGTCQTKFSCWSFSEGLSLCFESCNPLTQDCLAPGDLCTPSYGYGNGFMCIPDTSSDQGQAHAPCDELGDCAAGSLCIATTSAVECDPRAIGCCEPFCDTSLPNTCPGQGQECLPVYLDEDAPPIPPGFPTVGLCALPV